MFFTYGVRNLAGEIAQEYAKRQVRHLANLNALTTAFSVLFFFLLVLFAIANLVWLIRDCVQIVH
jgi:hypothetical protein